MTEVLYNPKIKPEHLARKAIVYLRQSTDKQVRQNKESQLLQYAVAERVRALGWQQVEIINSDLGSSAGLAAAEREGFERVLSLVALGEVGVVGSREVSRLSRTGLVPAVGGMPDLWNADCRRATSLRVE
jgi:DNA invertase Pin-like site-specific DNA recombinase